MSKQNQGWRYHTHVTPNEDDRLNDPLTRAFESFLSDLFIDEQIIKKELVKIQPRRLLINTNGAHDRVVVKNQGPNVPIFLKSRFLSNRKFKQRLVDYYNPINIFVKGPKEVLKRDGESTNQWIIELSPIHIKQISD
jgi:hypothetical protein